MALRPDPAAEQQTRRLGLRERSRLRRRVRFMRKRRELELRDLGGLIFDMYRFGSKRQDLVRDKLQEMFSADRELREFEHLLGGRQRQINLREAGVGGMCPRCQQLYSTEAKFCSRCGQNLSDGARAGVVVEPRTAPAPAARAYEPETQAWRQPEREAPREPEPAPQAWQAPAPQTWDEEPEPAPDSAQEPQEEPTTWREPVVHHTPAWQEAQAEPQMPQDAIHHTPAWQAAQPAASVPEPQEKRGRARPFGRRRRKTPQPGAHAGDEAQRQSADWEARYQASVQAQRRMWEAESRPRQPEPSARAWPQGPPSDGAEGERPEAGDPLASGSDDPRR